jgi:thiamine-monophosphate kinase
LLPPPIADLGEDALIERIRKRAGVPPAWLALGIGDDAAVLIPDRNRRIVVTTDCLVEDVHFRRAWGRFNAVGHKALAVTLSDLAAMGATPRACLLSLALPPRLPLADFDELIDGFCGLAASARAPLAGGNLSRSPGPLVIDVTALGSAHPRRVLTRSGGRPGDELYLSGRIGGAAAGLAILERPDQTGALPATEHVVARFSKPTPRLRLGRLAADSRAVTACVDLSDGLADAVHRIARASGTGAAIDAGSVPVDELPGERSEDGLLEVMAGGEDYELLFAVAPRRRGAFLAAARRCPDAPVTRIGQLTRDPAVVLAGENRLQSIPPGFRHF